jgi:hypothetical protein
MAIISIVVFLSALIATGILLYVYKKQFFWIPDYKSPKYGVSVWFGSEIVNGLEKIDLVMDAFTEIVNKDFPGISAESLKNKFGILKIKFCSSEDIGVYVALDEFKADFPELTPKTIKVFGDEEYVMVNGKTVLNNLFVRNIGKDIIKDTALVHEIVHFIIESYQIVPNGDYLHKNPIFWEGIGWVSLVLNKFN